MQPIICTLILSLYSTLARSAELIIAANPNDGVQRSVFLAKVNDFRLENPELQVTLNIYEHENFKAIVNHGLGEPPAFADVLFWFGGASLRYFADHGKLQVLTPLWQQERWDQLFSQASREAVSRKGQQYGLPISYYHWGLYYRKSMFSKFNLHPPDTWEQLLELAQTLKAEGIKPFSIGMRNAWPAAGWFDYLNLRINGLRYHQSLLDGCIVFTDNGVKEAFKHWQQLLESHYFIDHGERLNWKGALPYLYHQKAAMLLMGNFFLPSVPDKFRDDIGFFPFPVINPDIPRYEDAPTDILVIPKHAPHSEQARHFLRFMAEEENQSDLASALGMIPPYKMATLSDDEHIRQGFSLLNSAEAVSQFFDRDTRPEFAALALPIFVEFMKQPERIDMTLVRLEHARREVWSSPNEDCPQ